MQNYSPSIKHILFICSAIVLQSFSGCNTTNPEPPSEVKEPITVTFNNFYKQEPFVYHKVYKSPQGNPIWFTQKKYYLSNIVAVRDNGVRELIADIAILDQSLGTKGLTISGNITKGNYEAISFDLGVREDLNLKDPATYDVKHPLSVTQNMYWGWSTQYIFSKIEGFEVASTDTISFVIHTGTQDLYRPEIRVNRNFSIETGGKEIEVKLDIFNILAQPKYTFNLTKNGQSHTVDNLELAVQYMDNFSKGFN